VRRGSVFLILEAFLITQARAERILYLICVLHHRDRFVDIEISPYSSMRVEEVNAWPDQAFRDG
jgi:hypothetical protein